LALHGSRRRSLVAFAGGVYLLRAIKRVHGMRSDTAELEAAAVSS
jgi:hypothetical protein